MIEQKGQTITNRPIIYLDEANKYKKHNYWVIRTLEKEPRFIETIAFWNGITDYSLVYNINFAKVYESLPQRTADKFEKITGLKCCFQEADEQAFKHYKKYEAYCNGDTKLTLQEKILLKEELDAYRREHDPLENKKF